MTIIEKNEDENYVITISLSELITVIFAIYYAYNLLRFIGGQRLK